MKIIAFNQFQKLSDLIRLHLAFHVLQIDEFRDIWMRKDMMAASYSGEPEAECLNQDNHIRKTKVGWTGDRFS